MSPVQQAGRLARECRQTRGIRDPARLIQVLVSRPLLIVGEAAVATGYARVAHSLASQLLDEFQIHHLSRFSHTTLPPAPWPIHLSGSGGDGFAARFDELIRTLRPGAVIVCHDLWRIAELHPVIAAHRKRVPVLAYAPLDGPSAQMPLLRPLFDVRYVVAYTESQAAMYRAGLERWRGRVPLVAPPVATLPLGVDTDTFGPLHLDGGGAPLAERHLLARRTLFPGRRELDDAFLVLNANRNHLRKRLDLTAEAFAMFAAACTDDVRLCLHSGPRDPMGWDLAALAARHGITDRVLFTSNQDEPAASDAVLNLVYNACDVGLNTSVGEGFGLVAFEHAATGAPQVVPEHTACGELWGGSALRVPATRPCVTTDVYREEQRVHADDVAAALAALHGDATLRRELGLRGYANARSPRYDWARIASQWAELIAAVWEEPERVEA